MLEEDKDDHEKLISFEVFKLVHEKGALAVKNALLKKINGILK